MSGRDIVVAITFLSSGLMAGLFFGWGASVVPGLARVGDQSYVTTMQNINRAIVNPVFLLPFILTPVFMFLAGVLTGRNGDGRGGWLLLAAAAVYVIGVLGVTAARNIPLNNGLDQFDLASAHAAEVGETRRHFETNWNRWNHVRAGAAILSFALVVSVAVSPSN